MPDPDLEIRGRGWGGDGLPKNVFRPFGPQFGPKISGGRAPSLDPPLSGKKLLETRRRTKNKLNPHKASRL